ncbi:MAG: hypothetical protein ACPG4X_00445 [Pikeienuella sp.]
MRSTITKILAIGAVGGIAACTTVERADLTGASSPDVVALFSFTAARTEIRGSYRKTQFDQSKVRSYVSQACVNGSIADFTESTLKTRQNFIAKCTDAVREDAFGRWLIEKFKNGDEVLKKPR